MQFVLLTRPRWLTMTEVEAWNLVRLVTGILGSSDEIQSTAGVTYEEERERTRTQIRSRVPSRAFDNQDSGWRNLRRLACGFGSMKY